MSVSICIKLKHNTAAYKAGRFVQIQTRFHETSLRQVRNWLSGPGCPMVHWSVYTNDLSDYSLGQRPVICEIYPRYETGEQILTFRDVRLHVCNTYIG